MEILRGCGEENDENQVNEKAVGQKGAGKLTITKIAPAVKNENRVNVFVNDKYSFSLDIAQVVDLGVKVGREISSEELAGLKQASEFGRLYQRALEWALLRPRSVKEAKDYLKNRQQKRKLDNLIRARNLAKLVAAKKSKNHEEIGRLKALKLPMAELPEIDDESVRLVIERLADRGYLDDTKFAKYYVENRFAKKGVSKKRLEIELVKKGVDKIIIDDALADSDRDEEAEIQKIIAKKRAKYSDDKLIAYLCRQGFSYQLVQDMVQSSAESDGFLED